MEALATQIFAVAGILAATLSGPFLALGSFCGASVVCARSAAHPSTGVCCAHPATHLREQLEEASRDADWDIALLMVVPLMALTLYLAQSQAIGRASSLPVGVIFGIGAAGFVAYMVRKLWKSFERIDKLKAGFDAELAVGQELDQLMRQGAAVFHDVPGEKFNIDHVVIARQGVFAVETKGYSKRNEHAGRAGATVSFDGQALRFPSWTTRAPLDQADRQAQWLGQWLTSAVGTPVQALPVVALPGWFVERTGRGSVRVFNGRELAGLLRARGTQPLSEEDVQRVVHQVGQRCRTVTPRF